MGLAPLGRSPQPSHDLGPTRYPIACTMVRRHSLYPSSLSSNWVARWVRSPHSRMRRRFLESNNSPDLLDRRKSSPSMVRICSQISICRFSELDNCILSLTIVRASATQAELNMGCDALRRNVRLWFEFRSLGRASTFWRERGQRFLQRNRDTPCVSCCASP